MHLLRNTLIVLLLPLLAFLLILPLAGLTPEAPRLGSITGKITFDGAAPRLRPVDMASDQACARMHSDPVLSEMLVLGEGNTMGNVFVQIKNAPDREYPTPKEPVIIDQVGCL